MSSIKMAYAFMGAGSICIALFIMAHLYMNPEPMVFFSGVLLAIGNSMIGAISLYKATQK